MIITIMTDLFLFNGNFFERMLMSNNIILEASVYSIDGIIAAKDAGADRVELCDNIQEGGTTPSYGMIRQAKKIDIPLFVIIRPRGGDFVYCESDIEVMLDDIAICRQLGVEGVVFGLLLPDGSIDLNNTARLVEAARPMQVTFHRAFDMCQDARTALKQLVGLGVERVLTSGQRNTAFEGKDILAELNQNCPEGIKLLIGSGVNADNLKALHETIQADEYHMSAVQYESSSMEYKNPYISMGNNAEMDEFRVLKANPDKLVKAKQVIDQF